MRIADPLPLFLAGGEHVEDRAEGGPVHAVVVEDVSEGMDFEIGAFGLVDVTHRRCGVFKRGDLSLGELDGEHVEAVRGDGGCRLAYGVDSDLVWGDGQTDLLGYFSGGLFDRVAFEAAAAGQFTDVRRSRRRGRQTPVGRRGCALGC